MVGKYTDMRKTKYHLVDSSWLHGIQFLCGNTGIIELDESKYNLPVCRICEKRNQNIESNNER